MNRPLKKQTTRSPCRSRLSSLTSLFSHISTGVANRGKTTRVPVVDAPGKLCSGNMDLRKRCTGLYHFESENN
jgi:hypothetical protein